MWFKKNNIKKASPLIPNTVWIIALCIIFLIWLFLIKNIDFFNFKIDENNWFSIWINNNTDGTSIIDDKLNNQENKEDKINILVVWRWWWDHDAPNLTDTIILASVNSITNTVSMMSIPRDLFVDYPWEWQDWKINWLYAKYKFESGSSDIWMKVLKEKVTEITWEEIDFYANIDFNGFIDVIDTIWWIEIEIPTHFVDDQYPDWNWGYKTLVFRKWTWIFDWESALKYARSRHSTSDFDRSMRQQQVIKSIKEKLTWSYFLTSPLKIRDLYDVFINRVDTDINFSTILKLAYKVNSTENLKILSYNLNDSCFYWSNNCKKWWFLYTPNREYFWWMSVLMVEWATIQDLNNYNSIKEFADIVFNEPEIELEKYKINIFNSLKVNHLAWELSNNVIKYWFNIPEKDSIWNTTSIYDKSVIYYNNIEENSATIRVLKKFFDWEFIKTDLPKYSTDNANIEIIIWEDYLLNKEIFKF